MVVTDDEVYPAFGGILHLVHRLDATVQGDNQRAPMLRSVVNTAERDAVAFQITVGDIVVQVFAKRVEELVHQRHCRRTVHVIVSVDEYLLALCHRAVDAVHRFLHVFHQIRVMQILQTGTNETPRHGCCRQTATNQYRGR